MSAGFLIAEDQPLIMDGQTIQFLVRQLVRTTDWGELDYLLVDLPPGTADVQQILLQELTMSGAILVVSPQDVAHLDGKKAVHMFRRAGVPTLGVVENMAGLLCPHCGERIDVFAPVPEERAIWNLGIPRLGEIPLDPVVSRAGDSGVPLLVAHPDSPQARAFRAIATQLPARLDAGQDQASRSQPVSADPIEQTLELQT
jgi:ATP-binding protein involved in chromosome partitioning